MNRIVAASLFSLVLAAPLVTAEAQRQAQPPRLQASGRAAVALCLQSSCRLTDTAGVTILIEYGTPSARGRAVENGLIPLDSVWRLGANTATHLITKVPLTIGGTAIPAGKYTLFLRSRASGTQLIVNDSINIWGVPYTHSSRERAQINLRTRNLAENIETLSINLVPSGTVANAGVLSILWGRREYSADFTAQPGGGRSGTPPRPDSPR